MTFDEQVAALRGAAGAARFRGPKSDATPEQWAAFLNWGVEDRRKRGETLRAGAVRRYRSDPDKYRAQKLRDYAKHREKRLEVMAAYRAANADAIRRQVVECNSRRYKSDPAYRIACNLRCRLNAALRGGFRAGSAVRDLGCTGAELKTYLEARFLPGMSWDRRAEWHIDHITPLSSFDLSDPDQVRAACHYTNLQPLWALDNIRKGVA